MFSIIIPTWNNLRYLKICIDSILKNSTNKHEIIVHVNEGKDKTLEYLDKQNLKYTYTKYNAGICEGVNLASMKSISDYIMYSHDDFYFCPEWDVGLLTEISEINHNKFYISSTMIGQVGHNSLDCGDTYENFDEQKLLDNFQKIPFNDFQGSTWAPHVVHKDYWKLVKGFSEEFYPGSGSDPDLNMKLWNSGIRIFKGLANSRVYHFGSKTLRREKNSLGSRGGKLFLLKWGISIGFFKKYYLRYGAKYNGPLDEPKKNIIYFFNLLINKINRIYIKYIYNYDNKLKIK